MSILSEIARELGGVSPFYTAASAAPAVLDGLWAQARLAYWNNSLPALFKERLFAYLSRYCQTPFCIVCHSCRLQALGLSGAEILALLETAPPLPTQFAELCRKVETERAPLAEWPEPGSELDDVLFRLSVAAFTRHPLAGPSRRAVRRLLGSERHALWLGFLAYIQTEHQWAEAHPEMDPTGDPSVRDHLADLLREEPRLEAFFKTYRDRVSGERRRREDELVREATQAHRAEEQARGEARRRDEFLCVLAHELRNPLSPIHNALKVLRQRGNEPVLRNWAQELLERQVGHLTHMVEDLLEVSRIVRRRIKLRLQRLDLTEAVRQAVEDYRHALEERRHTLELQIPRGPIWLNADPTRLAQVMNNLLSNACKFTNPGGRVSVICTLEERRLSEGAAVTVADTGVGLKPEAVPRLFSSFFQADRTLARTSGGLGLGLALVKGLVELHSGQVSGFSAGLGMGAEFTFWLPLADVAAPNGKPARVASEDTAALRVLLVEDNRDIADSMRMLLEASGHKVAVAYDGLSGVAEARRFRPQAVLCDIGLPELDGYGVARALRNDPTLSRVRLIAVSGYGRDEDRRRASQAGFDHHFTKPIEYDELRKALEEVKS
jgi:signal transduction histidine kinase/ActR/RegA family two-component response regulator